MRLADASCVTPGGVMSPAGRGQPVPPLRDPSGLAPFSQPADPHRCLRGRGTPNLARYDMGDAPASTIEPPHSQRRIPGSRPATAVARFLAALPVDGSPSTETTLAAGNPPVETAVVRGWAVQELLEAAGLLAVSVDRSRIYP